MSSPPAIGDVARPLVDVTDDHGTPTALPALLTEERALLIFYRGHW